MVRSGPSECDDPKGKAPAGDRGPKDSRASCTGSRRSIRPDNSRFQHTSQLAHKVTEHSSQDGGDYDALQLHSKLDFLVCPSYAENNDTPTEMMKPRCAIFGQEAQGAQLG